MKYKIITIKNFPAKERLEKLGVSIRQLGIEANVDDASINLALRDKLILCKETAEKIIEALERLKKNPVLVKEKIAITNKGRKGQSCISEEQKQEMIKLRKSGLTLQEIGNMFYGLTKERIRQIIGISYRDLRRMGIEIKILK